MSIKAIHWALSAPVKHSPAKHILTVMAFHERDNMKVWASVTTLAAHTAQDRKTVLANLKRLAELGVIEDTGERTGQTGSVVVWRLVATIPEAPETESKQYQNLHRSPVPDLEPLSSTKSPPASEAEAVPGPPGSSTKFSVKQYQKPPEAVPNSPTEPLEPRDRTLKNRIGENALTLTLVENPAPTEHETTDESMTKGTRLSPDWMLTKALGDWALNEVPGWTPDDVRRSADTFRDYWVAKPGKDGVKLDWSATWRNWVRKERSYRETRMGSNVRSINRAAERNVQSMTDRERGKAEAKRLLFGNSQEVIDV